MGCGERISGEHSHVILTTMSTWPKLLEIAALTPSPHNVQPWRVRILDEHEADLFIEAGRTLPKADVTGSFIISTMGMFIEALNIVAENNDLQLEYEMQHESAWYVPAILNSSKEEMLPFARLRLTPRRSNDRKSSEEQRRYDESLFHQRRTSRISLEPEAVREDAARALTEVADEWGQRYTQITRPEQIEGLLEQNTKALFEDLNSPEYHDEIVEWFRFTRRAARAKRDGLDYRCMNTSPVNLWLIARFPRLLQLPLTSSLLRKTYRTQTGIVPTIGLLAGEFWEAASALQTGRFLMRFWLEMAQHNLYMHPYGNLVTNRQAAQWCRAETGIDRIWLIFKIGYSKEPPQSYRRAVADIILT